jgi:8-oxo-dGTP pyrophosphatase MutT (NUDIX family)
MKHEPTSWRLLEKRVVLETEWASVQCNRYATPDDRIVPDYLIIRRRPFVLVVAEESDKVILLRQYRPATDRIYTALPAGFIDSGENAIQAAARELLEETGFRGHSFTEVGVLDPLPGYILSPAHVVRCRFLPGGVPSDPDGEVRDVFLLPWTSILDEIRNGGINEMQAVAALLLVNAFHSREAIGV